MSDRMTFSHANQNLHEMVAESYNLMTMAMNGFVTLFAAVLPSMLVPS